MTRAVEHKLESDPIRDDAGDDSRLIKDERWALVQRIVSSDGFQRAAQLRNIMLFISRRALLQPDQPIREHDIAQDVLGRRADFDPSSDNIVRVQISQLRRRLSQYFESEGRAESWRVTLPRGSYKPVFLAHLSDQPRMLEQSDPRHPNFPADAPSYDPSHYVNAERQLRSYKILCFVLCGVLLLFSVGLWSSRLKTPLLREDRSTEQIERNPFLSPLLSDKYDISIVLPDMSLTVIQNLLKEDVAVADYIKGFPDAQLEGVNDREERNALEVLASKRSTSFSEALVAAEFMYSLRQVGARAVLRYARDLHTRDFNDGSSIILGSRRSNPWTLLFSEKDNYQFVEDAPEKGFYFKNANPAAGQQPIYVPDVLPKAEMVSYVDITLRPNLTGTGHVLLINGSDVQATESAAHYILAGHFPAKLQSRPGNRPQSIEVFLRGKHVNGEDNTSFEVLDIRTQ